MNIAILYGLFEGPLCGQRLQNQLRHQGYHIVSMDSADCIIAHSGAWLMYDDLPTSTRILLVDPAYRTDRSALAKSLTRVRYDLQHLKPKQSMRYTTLRLYNLYYLVTKFPYWLDMRRRYNTKDIVPLLEQANVYVFEASDPAWHDTAITNKAIRPVNTLPGDHDALWNDPMMTTDILGV